MDTIKTLLCFTSLLVLYAGHALGQAIPPGIDARYECSMVMNVAIHQVENAYVEHGGCEVRCTGNNRVIHGSIREGLQCADMGVQGSCRAGQCSDGGYPSQRGGGQYVTTSVYPQGPQQQNPQNRGTCTLDLTIKGGHVPQMKNWYQRGNSHTYVVIAMNTPGNRLGITPVVRDTLMPQYNYRLTAANAPENANVLFTIYESRKNSHDDFIGSVVANVHQVMVHHRNGVLQRYFIAHKDGNNKYYLDIIIACV